MRLEPSQVEDVTKWNDQSSRTDGVELYIIEQDLGD